MTALVPATAGLDIRDLDVRDLAATNGSFNTLSINGDPVIGNPYMSVSPNTTTFSGALQVGTLSTTGMTSTTGSFNTLSINGDPVIGNPYMSVSPNTTTFSGALQVGTLSTTGMTSTTGSFNTLTVNGQSVVGSNPNMTFSTGSTSFSGGVQTGSLNATDSSFNNLQVSLLSTLNEVRLQSLSYPGNPDGTIVVSGNLEFPNTDNYLGVSSVSCDLLNLNGVTRLMYTSTPTFTEDMIGYTKQVTNTTDVTVTTSNTSVFPSLDLGVGKWMVTLQLTYQATTYTTPDYVYIQWPSVIYGPVTSTMPNTCTCTLPYTGPNTIQVLASRSTADNVVKILTGSRINATRIA